MKSLNALCILFICVSVQSIAVQSFVAKSEKRSINTRQFPLQDDEVWPDEVAHLFTLTEEQAEQAEKEEERDEKEEKGKKEGREVEAEEAKEEEEKEKEEDEGGDFSGRRKRRSIRGEEWTGVWPQRWSEAGNSTIRHPAPENDAFVYYYRPDDDTYVMSRCTSTVGAAVLILACPQPRGYKFHRIIDLKKVFYGWSMTEATCQYIEGDCTLAYEFMHKQIMRPSKPITEDDFFSVGPTYFCNRWDGGGREEWEFAGKMTCSIGARRASAALNPLDDQSNPYGRRFGYAWETCGTAYDWFDFIQAEYKCIDVMEPLGGAEEEPEKFFGCDQRSIAMKEEAKGKKGKKGKKEEGKER